MVRSGVAAIAGVAMLAATSLAPFTHLHVGGGEHHHAEDTLHDHHNLVHAHLVAHRSPVSGSDVEGARWDRHTGVNVVAFDTMLTELRPAATTLAALKASHVRPTSHFVAGRHLLSVPLAHGPPFTLPVLGRAPPA